MADTIVEIVTGRERRRRWSVEDKLRLVGKTYEAGARVRQVATSHDVYPGLLFTWRRQVRDGTLAPPPVPVFLPVTATTEPPLPIPPPVSEGPASRSSGQVEIELKDGSRLRVDASISLALLRRVLAALRG